MWSKQPTRKLRVATSFLGRPSGIDGRFPGRGYGRGRGRERGLHGQHGTGGLAHDLLGKKKGEPVWKLFGSLQNVARRLLDSVRFVAWEESWFDPAQAAQLPRNSRRPFVTDNSQGGSGFFVAMNSSQLFLSRTVILSARLGNTVADALGKVGAIFLSW